MRNSSSTQLIGLAMTFVFCAATMGTANAGDPQENGRRKGNRLNQGDRQVERGNRESGRPGGQGAGQRPAIDMKNVVLRMIGQFDADGDEKLDAAELTKLLTAMRERGRGEGMAFGGRDGNRGQRRPGAENGPESSKSKKQKRGYQDSDAEEGGDTPKRPGKKAETEVPTA